MNIHKNNSDDFTCKIISKYFTAKPGMDESLSDFQEKKITFNGPKKKKQSKSNTNKKDKKLKGQRDIRTLVKSRKNELLTYTKDFDQACRSSGLDIDSEQLQIAIALSESLQESKQQINVVTDNIKPLTARERSRKIKLTLQEYGFKVPNAVAQKKKRTVTDKTSKLLNTSELEKTELIRRKYLEILDRNPILSDFCISVECDHRDKEIYYKTTNIPYNKIRGVDEFYVHNLIEKTSHRTCLLRDWSEIPGRPLSPVVEVTNLKFDKVTFSQQELDCLLSHPLQEVQEMIKNKSVNICEEQIVNVEETMNLNSELKINNEVICGIEDDKHHEKYISTTQGERSQSPDLFDDDDYPTTVQAKYQPQYTEIKCSSEIDKTSFMDLTECIGNMNNTQKTVIVHSTELVRTSEISQDTDSTELESVISIGSYKDGILENAAKSTNVGQNKILQINNKSKCLCSETIREADSMEVTDCVISEFNHNNGSGNEVISKSICVEAVDVDTYLSENQPGKVNNNVSPDFIQLNSHYVVRENFENIDLTQDTDETIHNVMKDEHEKKIEAPISMDLTQSSNSDDDLPIVKLSNNKEESSDATIILNDLYTCFDNLKKNILQVNNSKTLHNISILDEKNANNKSQYTTTTSANIDSNIVNDKIDKMCSDSIVLQANINSSKDINDVSSILSNVTDSKIISEDNFNVTQSPEMQSEEKIDLTQSPELPNKTDSTIESLGKQNNISIDYDELYNNMMTVSTDMPQDHEVLINDGKDSTIESIDNENDQSNIINNGTMLNNTEENLTPSKVYSLIESPPRTEENYDSEAITNNSILAENVSIYSTNRNSYLPSVDVKKNVKLKDVITEKNNTELSSIKITSANNDLFGTPVNDQYIIKTQNVTPMVDYESMSTPARNKELEKYGIKPFKRKRAIQLLTYIYNQTHPVVEDYAIDGGISDHRMPSTSKKFKPNTQEETEQIPDEKQTSFQEFVEKDADKENNLYVETKVNPDIRKIDCCPDDWVFQTRDKSKVHSCRVPLHIAFHNYVSCRFLLRTAILRYEPVNIDIIHKDLIVNGYRYNPKELLKFLDKKCITVKTTENNARNKRN